MSPWIRSNSTPPYLLRSQWMYRYKELEISLEKFHSIWKRKFYCGKNSGYNFVKLWDCVLLESVEVSFFFINDFNIEMCIRSLIGNGTICIVAPSLQRILKLTPPLKIMYIKIQSNHNIPNNISPYIIPHMLIT